MRRLTEIGFYHLTRTGPDAALPALLGRTLAAGERALVLCGSEERVAALDAALWLCPDPDWLPHGTAATGEADLQPIWITARLGATGGTERGAVPVPARGRGECARSTASRAPSTCSTATTRRRSRRRGAVVGREGGRPRARLLAAGRAGVGAEGVIPLHGCALALTARRAEIVCHPETLPRARSAGRLARDPCVIEAIELMHTGLIVQVEDVLSLQALIGIAGRTGWPCSRAAWRRNRRRS